VFGGGANVLGSPDPNRIQSGFQGSSAIFSCGISTNSAVNTTSEPEFFTYFVFLKRTFSNSYYSVLANVNNIKRRRNVDNVMMGVDRELLVVNY